MLLFSINVGKWEKRVIALVHCRHQGCKRLSSKRDWDSPAVGVAQSRIQQWDMGEEKTWSALGRAPLVCCCSYASIRSRCPRRRRRRNAENLSWSSVVVGNRHLLKLLCRLVIGKLSCVMWTLHKCCGFCVAKGYVSTKYWCCCAGTGACTYAASLRWWNYFFWYPWMGFGMLQLLNWVLGSSVTRRLDGESRSWSMRGEWACSSQVLNTCSGAK